MTKKITLEPEFVAPKMSTKEQVWRWLDENDKGTYSQISEGIGRVRGGDVTTNLKLLIKGGYVSKRTCDDCGMHDVYEIIRKGKKTK